MLRVETKEERNKRVEDWMKECSKLNEKYGIELTRIEWTIKDVMVEEKGEWIIAQFNYDAIKRKIKEEVKKTNEKHKELVKNFELKEEDFKVMIRILKKWKENELWIL